MVVSAATTAAQVGRPKFCRMIEVAKRLLPEMGCRLKLWWPVASGTAQRSSMLTGDLHGLTEK